MQTGNEKFTMRHLTNTVLYAESHGGPTGEYFANLKKHLVSNDLNTLRAQITDPEYYFQMQVAVRDEFAQIDNTLVNQLDQCGATLRAEWREKAHEVAFDIIATDNITRLFSAAWKNFAQLQEIIPHSSISPEMPGYGDSASYTGYETPGPAGIRQEAKNS